VTQQDHETNIGAWRRKAEERGATVREWAIDPETGLLDPADLDGLLNRNTRWVFFTHCSNIVGTVNPVAGIVERIRQQSPARVGVDAVAYAPHHIADLRALDVDLYVFSLYKVYGPHQGILYVRRALSSELEGQSHYFNRDQDAKRYNPAGPQHSQVAASAGVLDYFEQLYCHHGGRPGDPVRLRLERLHDLIHRHETRLATVLLDNLRGREDIRLLGKADCAQGDRAPTIAFQPRGRTAAEVTRQLQALGIGTEHGDFYAPRALDHLGIDGEDGVVRLSLVHYNSVADAERIVAALDRVLGRKV
jgi:selenocysteine lyase/cysteine desulfurase